MHERITGKNIVWILLSIALMLSAGTGYALSATNQGITKSEGDIAASVLTQERVSENCQIETRYTYTLCSHIKTSKQKVSAEDIGLTENEFRQKHSEFTVETFASDKIIITKKFDQYCDEHFILQEQNGEVHVMKNEPGTADLKSIMKVDISIETLTESEMERLKFGRVFSTLEEIEEYIESVES